MKLIVLHQKHKNLLNNIIEEFKDTTRFIFICNEGFKINESIQSSCMILYFPRISKKNLNKKLILICENENIKYTKEGLIKLIFCSSFDIRQCINNLECLSYSYDIVSVENVEDMICLPKVYFIKEIINNCYDNNLANVIKITKELYESGNSATDIILTFMKYIENKEDDPDFKLKCDIEVYKILSSSFIKINLIDNMVQLSACMVSIYSHINL